MEKICKNCEYFVQVSSDLSKFIWGDCMKDAKPVGPEGKKERGYFTWADRTCIDFKPRQGHSKRPDKL